MEDNYTSRAETIPKSPQSDINATPNKANPTPHDCRTDNRSPNNKNPARKAPVYTTSNTTVANDRSEHRLDTQPHNNPVPTDGNTGNHQGKDPSDIPLANQAPINPTRNNGNATKNGISNR